MGADHKNMPARRSLPAKLNREPRTRSDLLEQASRWLPNDGERFNPERPSGPLVLGKHILPGGIQPEL